MIFKYKNTLLLYYCLIFTVFILPCIFWSLPLRAIVGSSMLSFSVDEVLKALFLVFSWLFIFSLTSYLMCKGRQSTSCKLNVRIVLAPYIFFGFLAPIFCVVSQVHDSGSSLSALMHLLGQTPLYIISLGYIILTDSKLNGKLKIICWLVLILNYLSYVTINLILGNAINTILFSLVTFFIIYSFDFTIIKKLFLSAIILLVLLINLDLKHYFRDNFYGGPVQRVNIFNIFNSKEKVENFKKSLRYDIKNNGILSNKLSFFDYKKGLTDADPNYSLMRVNFGENIDYKIAKLINRLNWIISELVVLQKSPSSIPYWGFETYKASLYILVPRAVMPTKPSMSYGHDFGVRYGWLLAEDTSTSINMNIFSEALASGGIPTLLLSGLLMGLIFGASFLVISRSSSQLLKLFLFISYVKMIPTLESGMSFYLGGLVHAFLFSLILTISFNGFNSIVEFYRAVSSE